MLNVYIYIYRYNAQRIYIYIYIYIGIMLNVFANGLGDRSSISDQTISKTQKWYMMLLCLRLSIIMHGSRVSGAILRKELRFHLHLDVVGTKKEPFGSSSTTVGQITYVCARACACV